MHIIWLLPSPLAVIVHILQYQIVHDIQTCLRYIHRGEMRNLLRRTDLTPGYNFFLLRRTILIPRVVVRGLVSDDPPPSHMHAFALTKISRL